VKWLAAALVLLAAPGAAVTIPVTTARSTGFDASGNLITGQNQDKTLIRDENWTFYEGNSLSALSGDPVGAYVVNVPGKPFTNPRWIANSNSSRWISPTKLTYGNGNHLETVSGNSYIAVTSFTIPAMTDPPNWPQWWLVMSGEVWADEGVAGNSFYLLDSSNHIVYTGTLTPSGSPLYVYPAAFQMQTWVDPGATYRLAFILPNVLLRLRRRRKTTQQS
jgi:hypothetical protein